MFFDYRINVYGRTNDECGVYVHEVTFDGIDKTYSLTCHYACGKRMRS